MSSTDVFNFNIYFDSEDVYRRVQYMGNMAKGRDSSLSLETSTLQENAVYSTNSLITTQRSQHLRVLDPSMSWKAWNI